MKGKLMARICIALLLVAALAVSSASAETLSVVGVMHGAVVLRVPTAAIDDSSAAFEAYTNKDLIYTEEQDAQRALLDCMDPQTYEFYMAEFINGGTAKVTVNIPEILDGQTLSCRRIGDYWYVCLYPHAKIGNSWSPEWRISAKSCTLENGALTVRDEAVSETRKGKVPIKQVSASTSEWSAEIKDAQLRVYNVGGVHIAVVRERTLPEMRASSLKSLRFDRSILLPIGHIKGGYAYYCAVLTDNELSALKEHGSFEILDTQAHVEYAGW